jgi:hypothetical protein
MSATIDRIRKLLALANNDAAAPNEAETAHRLAERLMAAAGLSEADIGASGEVDPVSTVRGERGVKASQKWVGILAVATSRVVGCTVYRDKASGCLVWVGTDAMRETAKELHGWLVRQVTSLGTAARKRAPEGHGRRSWLNAYRQGVAVGVGEKVREAVAARPPSELSGVALERQDAVKAAIKRCLPKLQSAGRANPNADGFAAGIVDGQSVEFRRSVGADRSRMLGAGGVA